MNKRTIEETLTQIVEIDYQSSQKVKELQSLERERDNALRKVRRELEFEIMKTARKTAKSNVQEFHVETERLLTTLANEKQAELNRLLEAMSKKQSQIVDRLFDEIFGIKA